jgi:hypothetical protein
MLLTRQAPQPRYAPPRYRNISGDPIVALLEWEEDRWFDDGYCRCQRKEKEQWLEGR